MGEQRLPPLCASVPLLSRPDNPLLKDVLFSAAVDYSFLIAPDQHYPAIEIVRGRRLGVLLIPEPADLKTAKISLLERPSMEPGKSTAWGRLGKEERKHQERGPKILP